ncbi:MAG: hypothetical protein H0U70_08335 [Tatlockia sp.]|nr:hypothetical protein [Tatlockia sp.]
MKSHIIIGNFGNHSLALMQALIERSVEDLHFVYVETGWADTSWPERILACSDYASKQGVTVHLLKTKTTFSEMIRDRQQFPSPKFQWCASFLKGLTILDFLDKQDPGCEAMIISGKRQQDSRRYLNLTEFDHNNELYQGRTLWYPLWQLTDSELVGLITRTGFPVLSHQSLECHPCIHASEKELNQLSDHTRTRLEVLEQQINETMYHKPIRSFYSANNIFKSIAEEKKINLQQFEHGCGAPWGCGE